MSDNRHRHAMEIAYDMACEQTKPLEKAAEKLHPAPAGGLDRAIRILKACQDTYQTLAIPGAIAELEQAAAALEAEKRGLRERALEEAAQYHDEQERSLHRKALTFIAGVDEQGDVEMEVLYKRMSALHKNSAAAIRALARASKGD